MLGFDRKMDTNLTIPLHHEFVHLPVELNNVHLREDIEESISWDLTASGEYTSNSAYKAQIFFGSTSTCINKTGWKVWAPPNLNKNLWLVGYLK
jgi:hypothetical protein